MDVFVTRSNTKGRRKPHLTARLLLQLVQSVLETGGGGSGGGSGRCGRLEQFETKWRSNGGRRRRRSRRFPAASSLLASPAMAGPFGRFRSGRHGGRPAPTSGRSRFFSTATPRLLVGVHAIPATAIARQQSGFIFGRHAGTGGYNKSPSSFDKGRQPFCT